MKKLFNGVIITFGDLMLLAILFLYFCAISILAFLLTVYDKKASKTHGRKKWMRVPEKYLMFVGFIGGSLVMYITMKSIRHKTTHKRFMKGLPAILTVQFVLIMAALYFLV